LVGETGSVCQTTSLGQALTETIRIQEVFARDRIPH
jgi:hypothetical protein